MAIKEHLSELPVTFFCIHGNHEQRPFAIKTHREKLWSGAVAYVEDAYPSILFAKDGEIYDFDGKKAIAIGGAYSVDKFYRQKKGYAGMTMNSRLLPSKSMWKSSWTERNGR